MIHLDELFPPRKPPSKWERFKQNAFGIGFWMFFAVNFAVLTFGWMVLLHKAFE